MRPRSFAENMLRIVGTAAEAPAIHAEEILTPAPAVESNVAAIDASPSRRTTNRGLPKPIPHLRRLLARALLLLPTKAPPNNRVRTGAEQNKLWELPKHSRVKPS